VLHIAYSWSFCRVQVRLKDQTDWRSFLSESPTTEALRLGHALWSTECSLSGCSCPGITPLSGWLAHVRRLFKTVSVGNDNGGHWFSEVNSCTLGHRHLKQIRNQLLRWVKRWVILLLQLSRPDLLTNLVIVHLLNWLVFYNAEGMILISTRCQKLLLLACARLDSCVGVVTTAWLWIAIWCLEIAYASHVLLLKTVRVLHLPWLGIPGMLSGLDGTIASKFLIEHD